MSSQFCISTTEVLFEYIQFLVSRRVDESFEVFDVLSLGNPRCLVALNEGEQEPEQTNKTLINVKSVYRIF
jgi:hypothetical protein